MPVVLTWLAGLGVGVIAGLCVKMDLPQPPSPSPEQHPEDGCPEETESNNDFVV